MAQGFKPLKKAPAASKRKGKSSSAPKPKAGRVIAPKKPSAVQEAKQRKRNTAVSNNVIEKEMVARAANGPLTIMKKAVDQGSSKEKK